MCLSPITVDNTMFNFPSKNPKFRVVYKTDRQKLQVPCGICASCIALKQQHFIQRVQMESLDNDLFYGTLTYNSESLPIADYGTIKFAYPDFSDWQKMIKMIRKDFPDLQFKYLLVSEYGGLRHRPHFHFILSLPKSGRTLADKQSTETFLFSIFLKYWRRNYGSTRKPIWKSLCTYRRTRKKYNFDLHYLNPYSISGGVDNVAFYVSKYLLKYDSWVEKFKRKLHFCVSDTDFKDAWKKLKPRRLVSHGFGSPTSPSVKAHIRNGINLALQNNEAFAPFYISKVNGKLFPLAPYYCKRFLSFDDLYIFRLRQDAFNDDSSHIDSEDEINKYDAKDIRLNNIRSLLDSSSMLLDFDDMTNINDFLLPDIDYETNRPSDGSEFEGIDFETDFADLPPDNVHETYLADSSVHRPNTFTWQYSLFDD